MFQAHNYQYNDMTVYPTSDTYFVMIPDSPYSAVTLLDPGVDADDPKGRPLMGFDVGSGFMPTMVAMKFAAPRPRAVLSLKPRSRWTNFAPR